MTRYLALIAAATLVAAPVAAAPGGLIGTLKQGDYSCELPGDAAGPAGYRQDALNFTVHNSSRYSTADGRGTYLRTDDRIEMTSGPKKGQKFVRLSDNFLRAVDAAGRQTDLRCVRRVQNNR